MRFTFVVFVLLLVGCSSKKIKDVSYLRTYGSGISDAPKMNIFVPRNAKTKQRPVLIFVHGGNWNSGRKGTYDLLGRNFARKGVVTIIPDYTLSPDADYDAMTRQIAAVIQWARDSVGHYKGNTEEIFITGHSAGGHLGALAVMNPKYGVDVSIISGIIFNDAAGLDMKQYLEKNPPTIEKDYLTTWTADPEKWQDASPIYFIDKNTPPFLIYIGDKTYASIKKGNSNFISALHPFQPNVTPIRLNKKHVPMVVQYFWPWSSRFDEVIEFINNNK